MHQIKNFSILDFFLYNRKVILSYYIKTTIASPLRFSPYSRKLKSGENKRKSSIFFCSTLSLNSTNNKYHCVRCGAGGFSIVLYARVREIDNKKAYKELIE